MRDCRNCKFAEWQYTNHTPARIHPNRPGRCTYRVVFTVPAVLDANEIEMVVNGRVRRAIWAGNAYENCPTWEQVVKEG